MEARQILQRQDGSEVRIVAQEFFGRGLTRSVGVYAHSRESPQHAWKLLSDRPHPNWREMSVQDYTEQGRSEMLQAVSPGEILRVINSLSAPSPGPQEPGDECLEHDGGDHLYDRPRPG